MSDIWLEDEDYIQQAYRRAPIYDCLEAEKHWDPRADLSACYEVLDSLQRDIDRLSGEYPDRHEQLDKLVDHFFGDWCFSGTGQKVAEYKLNSLYYLLRYRTGSSLSLAILLAHLLSEGGFDAALVFCEGSLMVHVAISDDEGYLIEPLSGQQGWYLNPENEEKDEQEPLEMVLGEEVYKLFLAHQKWAFIAAERFGEALGCVELLMDLLGDDPYERRDRGYLLNQLDCPKMAREDLEFFISECPDDPTIELIRHQIEELEYKHNTFH